MDLNNKIKQLSEKYFKKVTEIRRHLHQNPELSFQEFETSKYIISILKELNIKYESGIAKTGIGGSVLGEYVFNKNISAVISDSFNSYNSTIPRIAVGGSTYDFYITSIPVLAGVRYYFQQNIFGTIEAGVNILRASADVSDIFSEERLSTDYDSKISGGIGGGFRFDLSEQSVFELAGFYRYVEHDFSTVSLSAAVIILLGNL